MPPLYPTSTAAARAITRLLDLRTTSAAAGRGSHSLHPPTHNCFRRAAALPQQPLSPVQPLPPTRPHQPRPPPERVPRLTTRRPPRTLTPPHRDAATHTPTATATGRRPVARNPRPAWAAAAALPSSPSPLHSCPTPRPAAVPPPQPALPAAAAAAAASTASTGLQPHPRRRYRRHTTAPPLAHTSCGHRSSFPSHDQRKPKRPTPPPLRRRSSRHSRGHHHQPTRSGKETALATAAATSSRRGRQDTPMGLESGSRPAGQGWLEPTQTRVRGGAVARPLASPSSRRLAEAVSGLVFVVLLVSSVAPSRVHRWHRPRGSACCCPAASPSPFPTTIPVDGVPRVCAGPPRRGGKHPPTRRRRPRAGTHRKKKK